MKLESLLKPFRIADEQIFRQYTKLTKKWEDNGHSRYSLASFMNILALGAIFFEFSPSHLVTAGIISDDFGKNLSGLTCGEHPNGIKEYNGKKIIDNKYFYQTERLAKVARMPLFLTGVSFIGKSVFDLYNFFSNKDSSYLVDTYHDFNFGISALGLSSSIYIKDSDPKILDKAPFWKTSYEKIKIGIKNLIPQQTPIPQPSVSRNY